MALNAQDKLDLFNALLTYIDEFSQDRDMDATDAEGLLGLLQKHLFARAQHQLEHEAAQAAARAEPPVVEEDEPETGRNTDTNTPDSPDGFLPPQPWSPADDA